MSERLKVHATGQMIADRVKWARTPATRVRGILGRGLLSGEALIIDGGRQIHTFGLREAIDVVFCDRDWTVLHVVRSMKPLRMSRWVRRARFVIELRAGSLPDDLKTGDALQLS
jgi:uncharacterized membrane protein (UPF0127 family)